MPTVLTREQIREVNDHQSEFVAVPEWSPDDPEAGLWVHGLSGKARDEFDMSMLEQRRGPKGKMQQQVNFKNLRSRLVSLTSYNDEDPAVAKRIFTPEDIDWLGEKSSVALSRVYSVAQRLSGLSDEDVEVMTSMLGEAPSSDSGTVLPLNSAILQPERSNGTSTAETSLPGRPSTESNLSEVVG